MTTWAELGITWPPDPQWAWVQTELAPRDVIASLEATKVCHKTFPINRWDSDEMESCNETAVACDIGADPMEAGRCLFDVAEYHFTEYLGFQPDKEPLELLAPAPLALATLRDYPPF